MATINFSQFELKSTPILTDYLVGYKGDGTGEYRTPVLSIARSISATITVYQNLSANVPNKQLSITDGNTVSLSGFVISDTTTVPSATAISNIITVTQAQYNSIPIKDPNTLYVVV